MNKINSWLVIGISVLAMTGCSKPTDVQPKITEVSVSETTDTNDETLSSTKDTLVIESSESIIQEETVEKVDERLNAYNALPLDIKIKLIATIVDDRAIPVEIPDFERTMFYDFYQVYEDEIYINVHSGAGVGHPIYLFHYDEETVTPIEGIVRVTHDEYQMVEGINQQPVKKVDLYDQYAANPDLYHKNIIETIEADSEYDTKTGYEELKNLL